MNEHTSQLRSFTRWLSIPIVAALVACGGGGHGGGASQGGGSAALQSFEITPANPSAPAGTKLTLAAKAHYADGSTVDVTADATWDASDTTHVLLRGQGVVITIAQGTTDISATYQGVQATTPLTITQGLPLSMTLSPANATMAKGASQQFSAFANISGALEDVTSVSGWTSSNPDAASVDAHGVVTAVAAGTTTLSAAFAGTTVNAQVTITDTTSSGGNGSGANGSGGDGSGTNPLANLASISLSPSNDFGAINLDRQFTATGIFSDGTNADITSLVTWTTSDSTIATISAAGLLHPIASGIVSVQATAGGIIAATQYTVTAATLTSMDVTPDMISIANGTSVAFTATGYDSDGNAYDITNLVGWSSSDASVAAVSAAGVVTGMAPGPVTITAQLVSLSDSSTLTVTSATLSALAVTPTTAGIPRYTNQQFTAIGTFSDGSTQDLTQNNVTWSVSDSSVASVSTGGLVTGTAPGTVTVTAAFQGVSTTASLDVLNTQMIKVYVNAPYSTLPLGYKEQLTAQADFLDLDTNQTITGQDVTATRYTTWTGDSFVSLSNASGSQGLATAIAAGSSTVTVTYLGMSGTAAINVDTETLIGITVSANSAAWPYPLSVKLGDVAQLNALGTFSSGTQIDITSQVAWRTSPKKVAWLTRANGAISVKGASTGTATLIVRKGKLKASDSMGTLSINVVPQ